MRTFDIVVTTIFEPDWLDGYLENIERYGHSAEVTLRIIGDRKTPPSVWEAAKDARRRGFSIDCPTLDEQEEYVRGLGLSDQFIPWNTDNRRNIGYLRAWESGADVLISIDDDNYCRPESDFIMSHSVVGRPCMEAGPATVAAGGPWFNICELLQGGTREPIFARGFPYSARQDFQPVEFKELSAGISERRIAVNAGLWLDDPDVDAVTRLALRPTVETASENAVILDEGTWSPINTQNTALHRDAVPTYYYVRMGFPVKGMLVDRFGDIWSGYLLQRCAEHLGEAVRIGSPVADHRRTSHNLFKDLYQELAGIVLTEELLPWLRETRLSATGYAEAYAELADALAFQAGRFQGFLWDEGGRDFLAATAQHMRTWLGAIQRLAGS